MAFDIPVYHRTLPTRYLSEAVLAGPYFETHMAPLGWSLTPFDGGYEEFGSPPIGGAPIYVPPVIIEGGDIVANGLLTNGQEQYLAPIEETGDPLGWGKMFGGGGLAIAGLVPWVAGGALSLIPRFLPVLARFGRTVVQFLRSPTGRVIGGAGAVSGVVAIASTAGGDDICVPAEIAPYVAYTWSTGTAQFYRLKDGRIAVCNKMGVWRVYRPAKHIVIPRDPKIGTLLRAHKKVNKLVNRLGKQATKRTKR